MPEVACELITLYEQGVKYQIAGFADGHVTQRMRGGRTYENDLLTAIYERYGKGGVYYDFGAFIGTHTLYFLHVCKADLVVAVEPNPVAWSVLMENTKQYGHVEVIRGAVSHRKGRGMLWQGANDGGVRLIEEGRAIPVFKSGSLITAPPKLVKVDVEEMEYQVLCGMRAELLKHRPIVVVEAQEPELKRILARFPYKVFGTFCHTPTHILEPL